VSEVDAGFGPVRLHDASEQVKDPQTIEFALAGTN
jgi:hypothetical protein